MRFIPMNKILLTLLLPVFVTACSEPVSEPPEVVEEPAGLSYPVTETVDHVDNYHGTEVADPFRWLEDDGRPVGTNLSRSLHEWAVVLAIYQSALERRPVDMAGFDPQDNLLDRYVVCNAPIEQ